MAIDDQAGVVDRTTKTLRIIIAALTGGVMFFLVIAVLLSPLGKKPAQPVEGPTAGLPPILTLVACGAAVLLVPMSYVMPRLIAENQVRAIASGSFKSANPALPSSESSQLATVCVSSRIIGAALNEGPAFLAAIAYMLEGHVLAILVAVVLLALLALRFPSRDQVDQWIQDNLGRVAELRHQVRLS